MGWSFKGFYKGRWEIFIDEVIDCIKQNKKCELDILDDKIKTWNGSGSMVLSLIQISL